VIDFWTIVVVVVVAVVVEVAVVVVCCKTDVWVRVCFEEVDCVFVGSPSTREASIRARAEVRGRGNAPFVKMTLMK
jgi:hypothetical protein